jgi:uncharacterized membrane protein
MENILPKPWELHPVLVHFPIAFLFGGVTILLWGLVRPSDSTNRLAAGMLLTGVICGWVAAAAGGLAYYTVPAHTEFGHTLMFWHLGIAIGMLVLFSVLAIWRWRTRESNASASQVVVAVVGLLMVTVTGHLGGTIVLRNGAGVDPAILSAEVRGGHAHQGGHEQMAGMGHASGGHDMAGMKDMPGMATSSAQQVPRGHDMTGMNAATPAPSTTGTSSHNMADMKNMPGMQPTTPLDHKETKTSIEGLSQLSETERASAEKQLRCPVSDELIGAMGKPIKVTVKEQDVWLCCDSCKKKLLANPDEYLFKLNGNHNSPQHKK